MENNEIKNLAEILKAEELKKQLKYETLNKKALQAIEQKNINTFIKVYDDNLDSIEEKIEAISTLIIMNDEPDKFIKLRENILNADRDFIYLYDCAMFQCGFISPKELTQSVEDGIKQQCSLAYALKSFFYNYGIAPFEVLIEAIRKAILLEPNNLEFKKILNELEILAKETEN